MKKFLIVLVPVFGMLGCVSTSLNKNLAKEREALIEAEQWRRDLPSIEQQPVKPKFPHVKTHVLANGLTIYVMEDQRIPIAQVRLAFKNGSGMDPIGKAGLHNLTGLMLKEGTKKFSSLEIAEAFANLGTELTVGTSKDSTEFFSDVLSSKVDDVMTFLAQIVQEPRFANDDFERVKYRQQQVVAADQAVAAYAAQVSFLMAAYGANHPYAYPSKGDLRTLTHIDLEHVKKTYHESFGPNNAALIVVGDVTMSQVKKLAKKLFANWRPLKKFSFKVAPIIAKKEMETHLVARSGMPHTFLLVGQPVATAKDKDLATLEVFQQLLAGLPSSRLDANLREKKGWTYGVSSLVNPLLGPGPMMTSTSIQVPFGSEALAEILNEFENLKTTPVSDEELKAAKEGIQYSFASRYNTVEKNASSIARNFVYDLKANHDELFYEQIGQVTKEKIMNAAKRIFNRSSMVAVAVGDVEVMQVPLAKMKVGRIIVDNDAAPQK